MFVAVEGPGHSSWSNAGWCAEHQRALDQTRSRATRGAQARSERRGVPPTCASRPREARLQSAPLAPPRRSTVQVGSPRQLYTV